jgi:hypothetical protein
MARKPTSSKGSPSGPSASTAAGDGSVKSRNRVGAAAGDSSKRAADIAGGTGDDKAPSTEGGEQQTERSGASEAKGKKESPEAFVVLTDRAIITDGKDGSDMKVCSVGDEVKLTPSRARQYTDAGVQLVTKEEYKRQHEKETA